MLVFHVEKGVRWLQQQYVILFLFLKVVPQSKDLSHALGLYSAQFTSHCLSQQHLSSLRRLAKCTASRRSERRHPLSELQHTQTFSFSCNSECSLAVDHCRSLQACICVRVLGFWVGIQTNQEKAQPDEALWLFCSPLPQQRQGDVEDLHRGMCGAAHAALSKVYASLSRL